MIEVNNIILDVANNGCKLSQKAINDIKYVNKLLQNSEIEHQEAKENQGFEKITKPSTVHVNGLDLSSAATVMKYQHIKIKDAQEKG